MVALIRNKILTMHASSFKDSSVVLSHLFHAQNACIYNLYPDVTCLVER